jgi:hypothetical protein
MRTGIAFVLTCAMAGAGAPEARASGEPGARVDEPVPLTAAAIEVARVPPVAFDIMQQELAALLEPTGVRLVWRRAGPSGETSPEELRVVFLGGPARGLHAGRGVLAATLPTGPAPTIWVYTPTVVESLGPAADGPATPRARRALGLALGRILAHELVHVLAPEIPHGHGVMAERFRLVALDQTRPVLSPLSARALEHGARAWVARAHRRGIPVAGGRSAGGAGPFLSAAAP